jgi:hypothetical protein
LFLVRIDFENIGQKKKSVGDHYIMYLKNRIQFDFTIYTRMSSTTYKTINYIPEACTEHVVVTILKYMYSGHMFKLL